MIWGTARFKGVLPGSFPKEKTGVLLRVLPRYIPTFSHYFYKGVLEARGTAKSHLPTFCCHRRDVVKESCFVVLVEL